MTALSQPMAGKTRNELLCTLSIRRITSPGVLRLIALWLGVSLGCLKAQSPKLYFHHLNTSKGLLQASCSFVYHDSQDFVWISSIEGLMRYDGQSIRTYRPNEADAKALKGKNIQSHFFEDSLGDIWFSSYDALNVYRRKTDDFDHFTIKNFHKDLKDPNYGVLLSERDKRLWVTVNNTLFWVRPDTSKEKIAWQYAGNIQGKRACAEKSGTANIETFYTFDRSTNADAGFWEYQVGPDSIQLKNHFFSGEDALPSLKVNAISVTGTDIVWVASNAGLVKFNKRTRAWEVFNEISSGLRIQSSEGLAADDGNKLWVSSNIGLALFDQDSEKYIAFYPPVSDGPDGPAKPTAELYLDPNRTLWCTVNKSGIDFTALDKPKFETFPFPVKNGEPFVPGSMAQDAAGVFWFGSNYDNLRKYDPRTPKHWEEIQEKIWRIANIPLKRLMVATMSDTSYVWDPLTRHKYYIKTPENKDITFGNILVTSSDEILGFPFETNGGVWRITFTNNQYIARRIGSDFFNFHFTAGFEDRNKQLYLAKDFASLQVYSRQGRNIRLKKTIPFQGETKTFYEDDQFVWVGGEYGLCRITKDSLSERRFDEKDGMPNTTVYGILPAGKQELWLSTNRGIIRLKTDSLIFRQYSLADGLQDFEFNTKSFMKTPDGRLWFGGTKGLNVFLPEKIHDLKTLPQVCITSLLVNDQPFVSTRNVTLLDSIEFSYAQNTITVNFVAIEYSDPDNNKLRYKLFRVSGKDYDDNWVISPTAKGMARYSNLPPGNYELHIIGANSDGVENPKPKVLFIRIRPPFYMTTEFYISVFLLIVLLIYLAVRIYIRNKLRIKNLQLREQRIHIEKQEALTQERNRIAAEMHDDFGSGLTAIQRISERAAANTPSPDARKAIENITDYSLELISNMREIIWAMSGKNDTLENLMAYISENSYRYLGNHNIDVDINQPEEIPDIEMSGERRRNIYLAVKESLHNVVKHANASSVTVNFVLNGTLDIHVIDNGKGFKNNNLAGNGMGNMAKRMEDIGGKMSLVNEAGAHLVFSVPIK